MPAVGGAGGKVSTTNPEPVTEPNVGHQIVIIHPGSMYLRIGLASDSLPVTIPHCIARRHRNPRQQSHFEDSWLLRPDHNSQDALGQKLQGLTAALETLLTRPMFDGDRRQRVRSDHLSEFNRQSKPELADVATSQHFTSVKHEPPFLIGQEALMVNPVDPYDLHWPLRRGHLNIHKNLGGTISSVIQDLYDIWSTAIELYLNIQLNTLQNYRAVLLIPDIYKRAHIRELISLLLDRIGFGSLFIVQESVCATFGSGVGYACVVDIGDQKTSVCCVEDGLSQKSTQLTMEFGGCDISQCFHWLLTRISFPYKDCDLGRRMDALFIQDLKETFCHLEQDLIGAEDHEVLLQRPSQRVVKYIVRMGDERILAPLSIFFPEMLGLKSDGLYRKQEKFASDPSDPIDDDYLLQTMSRHEQAARQRKKDSLEAANPSQDSSVMDDTQLDDDDTMDQSELSSKQMRPDDDTDLTDVSNGMIGIHQAILKSIEKCDSDDMKRRMYSCILVVGGGLMFPGAQSWLRYLVWNQMPNSMRLSLEVMDVITRPKDLDPRMTCWKGGSVMSCLDTVQELWIYKNEWNKYGIRVLRERAPFIW